MQPSQFGRLHRHPCGLGSETTWGGVMLVEANTRKSASAHVVVIGNEKGGSGKSTTAIHETVAVMKLWQRFATIDPGARQRTCTYYIDNWRGWARHARI